MCSELEETIVQNPTPTLTANILPCFNSSRQYLADELFRDVNVCDYDPTLCICHFYYHAFLVLPAFTALNLDSGYVIYFPLNPALSFGRNSSHKSHLPFLLVSIHQYTKTELTALST